MLTAPCSSCLLYTSDVVGNSMYPTLENGDKILVSDLFYKPKQGDIVVFRKDCLLYTSACATS